MDSLSEVRGKKKAKGNLLLHSCDGTDRTVLRTEPEKGAFTAYVYEASLPWKTKVSQSEGRTGRHLGVLTDAWMMRLRWAWGGDSRACISNKCLGPLICCWVSEHA